MMIKNLGPVTGALIEEQEWWIFPPLVAVCSVVTNSCFSIKVNDAGASMVHEVIWLNRHTLAVNS